MGQNRVASTDAAAKLRVRRWALQFVGPGRVWMPFCGGGRMAEPYDGRVLDASDVDAACVRAYESVTGRGAVQSDWRHAPFSSDPYSVADIDPYGGCAHAVKRFLDDAPLCDVVAVIVTDGAGQQRARRGRWWDWDRGELSAPDSERAAVQQESLPDELAAWIGRHPRVGHGAEVAVSERAGWMWYVAVIAGVRAPVSVERRAESRQLVLM